MSEDNSKPLNTTNVEAKTKEQALRLLGLPAETPVVYYGPGRRRSKVWTVTLPRFQMQEAA